uniref:Uncharacterized protein n=1 Tax=Zea mays TaxID=4577 RepID=B6TYF7_MAIZE|nr:hypothetical protein [Zea mays]
MGMRDKKRNQKRVLARRTAAPRPGEGKDFLPLEGGPGKKHLKVQQPRDLALVSSSRVLSSRSAAAATPSSAAAVPPSVILSEC